MKMKRKRIEEMSFRNMSDQHPMDEFKDRCNERSNALGRILMHYQNKLIHFQKGNPRNTTNSIDQRSEC